MFIARDIIKDRVPFGVGVCALASGAIDISLLQSEHKIREATASF